MPMAFVTLCIIRLGHSPNKFY